MSNDNYFDDSETLFIYKMVGVLYDVGGKISFKLKNATNKVDIIFKDGEYEFDRVQNVKVNIFDTELDTTDDIPIPGDVKTYSTTKPLNIEIQNSTGEISSNKIHTWVFHSILPSGGIPTTAGIYRIHTFTSDGNFIITDPTPVRRIDILCIAGGGGGGSGSCGSGGGAGGCIVEIDKVVSPATYAITVGAGGLKDVNGGDSSFGTLIETTGGGHGVNANLIGIAGGSGSGGGQSNTEQAGGAGIDSQGNSGGVGCKLGDPLAVKAGGGGGKETAGANYDDQVKTIGASGGAGITNNFSGADVDYAGGGGGGLVANAYSFITTPGIATHGGGNGGCNPNANGIGITDGSPGTPNTGGGGGGAGYNKDGGPGGSGIVIIRYEEPV